MIDFEAELQRLRSPQSIDFDEEIRRLRKPQGRRQVTGPQRVGSFLSGVVESFVGTPSTTGRPQFAPPAAIGVVQPFRAVDPSAERAGRIAGTVGQLAPLGVGLARGGLNLLRRGVPAARAVVAEVPEVVDVVGQRIAELPRVQGGVVLPRPVGPVPVAPTKPVPTQMAQSVLREPIHRRITTAAGELFTKAGIQRDPKLLVSDQITQLLETEKLPVQELAGTLQRHNLSITEFANEIFRPSIKDAARRLQALSVLQRRVNRLMVSAPEEAKRLREFASEVDQMAATKSLWKSPVQIWRTLLVSQPATAARNFVVGVGRIGLDTIEQGLNAGFQKVTGKPVTASPLEPLRALLGIFYNPRTTRAEVNSILQKLPTQWDRMFGSFMSDIATKARAGAVQLGAKDKILQAAEDGAAVTGVFNRTQEFVVRRAVFQATLWQRLRTRGVDLFDVIRRNTLDAVTEEDIAASVGKALEITFARRPEGQIGQAFVKLINGLGPLAAPAIPFPRFMVEALRFYFEFSPAGILKLLAPAERVAMGAGNFSVISRAIIGSGMLGTAYAFRKSGYAGERWYEGNRADGRTIDLRPFNPFAPYLFAADVIKRYQDGTLYRMDTKDIVTALVGANVRAGTGLYLLDQLIDQFTEEGRGQKALVRAGRVAGEAVAGLLTPLQAISDAMAQFDESLRVVRERGEEPLLGPIKARVPQLAKTLPEKESPTRAGPITREAPLLRQATGVSLIQPKNPAEQELDRLQFSLQEIQPSTGNARADRLVAKHMGPMVERFLVPVVRGTQYQRATDNVRAIIIRQVLINVRAAARQLATKEDPNLFARLQYERRPTRERRVIEEVIAPSGR